MADVLSSLAGCDPIQSVMIPIVGVVVAVMGVVTGLVWQFEWCRLKDLEYFLQINRKPLWIGLDRFLIFVRPLGTKWFLLMILALVLIWRIEMAASFTIAALITAAVERGIKVLVKRPRPFLRHKGAIVRQNPLPQDPSFPSGDATRIWFIFSAVLFGIHPSTILSVLLGFCAVAISIGRVRLGVHYPLDVWAGSGLGFGLGLAWSGLILY